MRAQRAQFGINDNISGLELLCNHYSAESSNQLTLVNSKYRSRKVMNFVRYKTMLIAKKHCDLYPGHSGTGIIGITGSSGTQGYAGSSGISGSSGTTGISCVAGTVGRKIRVRW